MTRAAMARRGASRSCSACWRWLRLPSEAAEADAATGADSALLSAREDLRREEEALQLAGSCRSSAGIESLPERERWDAWSRRASLRSASWASAADKLCNSRSSRSLTGKMTLCSLARAHRMHSESTLTQREQRTCTRNGQVSLLRSEPIAPSVWHAMQHDRGPGASRANERELKGREFALPDDMQRAFTDHVGK